MRRVEFAEMVLHLRVDLAAKRRRVDGGEIEFPRFLCALLFRRNETRPTTLIRELIQLR